MSEKEDGRDPLLREDWDVETVSHGHQKMQKITTGGFLRERGRGCQTDQLA